MHITSTATDINAPQASIYQLLTNCYSFKNFLPEQVQNWQAGENYCQFDVAGITTLKMEITEKKEYSKVAYKISNDKQIPVSCDFLIGSNGTTSELTINIDAEVPLFLQAMLKNPFQKVADTIVEKIKTAVEH